MRARGSLLAGFLLLLAAGAFLGVDAWLTARARDRLPSLPDLDARPERMAESLRDADDYARRKPRSPLALGELGNAYHANGFYDRALASYSLAMEAGSEDGLWPYCTALILMERGDTTAEAAALSKVVEAEPRHALAWHRLAEARFKLGDREGAERAWAKALENAPEKGESRWEKRSPLFAHIQLGRARLRLREGKREEARALLEEAVRRAPYFGTGHRLLATVLREMDRDAEAAAHQEIADGCERFVPPPDRALDLLVDLSGSSTFILKHANLAAHVGDEELAIRLARRAAEVAPDDPDAVLTLADLCGRFGRSEAALPALLDFRRRHPGEPGTRRVLEDVLREVVRARSLTHDHDRAERIVRDAIATCPEDVFLVGVLADLLFERNRPEEAIEPLRAAVAEAPTPGLRHRLAIALGLSGRGEESAAEFERILETEPPTPGLLQNLISVLRDLERYAQAEAEAKRLVALAPDDPRAHVSLADLAARLGHHSLAAKHARTALDLDPDLKEAKDLLESLPE